ncbi:hypothetical protein IWW36_001912 [Coemansia brasiliensis]|uniref:C2H2-type domain-containing protein n=1 Tax=Coemansia brasiliensis TaxID=2650707 RepID=A0A9W8IEI7_9FUNG|nr:hypothetical protein IWW36_001912 [Coemansia brasiliensis]
MQTPTATPRQRLASLNDTPQRTALSMSRTPATTTAATSSTASKPQALSFANGFIPEDYMGYLGGGPFNRFALALKSSLDNEIDWACARLASATQQAPEGWSIMQHAPFLLEAIVGALERARKDLSGRQRVSDIRKALMGDSGSAMRVIRAQERGELLATILFNIAQVGENAHEMAQDPRVFLEITQWLQHDGVVRMRAELLDVLDVLVPLAPVPPLEARIREWPRMSSPAAVDLLALVEAQLWAELVRLACCSSERTLVLGALRVMVQLIAWHPQLARDVLQLPVPRRIGSREIVGCLVNSRLAELVLSSDIEMVSAALELLLNTVRVEAMAKALDHERGRGATPVSSGAQTPVFGILRTQSREIAEEESAPSMLPTGLVSLVALVLQQWMAAVCPPPAVPPPVAASGAAGSRQAVAQQQQPQQNQGTNRPPTEPELREACTWVLLNYEFAQQQQEGRPLYVSINDLFSRYTIAKQGQTAPRIGRALTLNEIVRVVAAVFPRTNIQTVPTNTKLPGQPSETMIALHLKQKTQHIVPIPELPAAPASTEEAAASKGTPAAAAATVATAATSETTSANVCMWIGCQENFTSEEQAIQHLQTHTADADACRWRSCNRVPLGTSNSADIVLWLKRHVLIHGPFYTQETEADTESKKPADTETASAATENNNTEDNAKRKVLDLILPSSADQQQQQQLVLRLVLQGVGVVEQLQKWADRRSGAQGEHDCARVWRCSDEVVERIMYIAAQTSTPVAVYAARLLAALSKPNL